MTANDCGIAEGIYNVNSTNIWWHKSCAAINKEEGSEINWFQSPFGRSVIIGFQESQSYQRFAGRQQEVLSIIIKKQKANLNILPYLVRSSVLLLRHNS